MRIVLLRHGEPDVTDPGRLRAGEFHRWIDAYNSAGLKKASRPSAEALAVAADCATVVCSDLPRSVESAKALGIEKIDYVDPLFREAGLPYADFPSPRLPPELWAAWFRVLWLCGYSPNSESIREAKSRAAECTGRFQAWSAKGTPVLLVGHGLANRFIARELLAAGWSGPENPGRRYWEFGEYSA